MVGNDIKKVRKQLRLKQTEFAAICSIRPETLCRIEKGGEVPGYMDMIAFLLLRDEAAIKQALERRGLL
jgi:DNA-binding XRE family transcriptional regulator